MSRSIHTTRREFWRLAQRRFPNSEARAQALEKAKQEIERKRLIKRYVREERRREAPPQVATPSEMIPVEVQDTDLDEHVFHPLDETDVRAMLTHLPDSASEGIRAVRLALGRRDIEDHVAEDGGSHWVRDPFLGRLCFELMPGVYSPILLGFYSPKAVTIQLHAFVLDRTRLRMPERACELWLRLGTLSTLLHEIGHHHDFLRRRRRGRWLADDHHKREWHADARAEAWTREFGLPHLLERYPEDTRLLLDWLEQHGGVRFKLDELVPGKRYWAWLELSVHKAVEVWLDELEAYTSSRQARYELAWNLHLAEQYGPSLRVLERMLREAPDDVELLTLKADTFEHLGRAEEALAMGEALLARGIDSDPVWEVLCGSLEQLKEWARLLDARERWCVALTRRARPHDEVFSYLAVAAHALGDLEASERWIHDWSKSSRRPRPLERLREVVRIRVNRPRKPHSSP